MLAEVCALLGDTRRAARRCTGCCCPTAHRYVVVGMASCFGSCERYLGLLAAARERWDVAAEHFETALAANAEAGIVSMVRMARDD